jgi:hypothetical protein
MTRSRIRVGVALALIATVLVFPGVSWAQARGGRASGGGAMSGGGRSGGFAGRPGFNHPGFNHGFNHHHFNSSSVIFVGPSPFWDYAPSVAYAPPPVYIAPQFVYQSPPPAAYYPPAPSAPPGPRIVEFPTGHYELRGDGMSMPYTWVWIPNPPSAPPGPPPPPAAPPALPGGPTSRPAPPAPEPTKAIYRWTDENGVTTLTDDVNKVPERYRIHLVNRTHL